MLIIAEISDSTLIYLIYQAICVSQRSSFNGFNVSKDRVPSTHVEWHSPLQAHRDHALFLPCSFRSCFVILDTNVHYGEVGCPMGLRHTHRKNSNEWWNFTSWIEGKDCLDFASISVEIQLIKIHTVQDLLIYIPLYCLLESTINPNCRADTFNELAST